MFAKLKKEIQGRFPFVGGTTRPDKAYDIWSASYDDQPDNLMLALDNDLFTRMSANELFNNKRIIDIGCGTGRHWPQVLAQKPAGLQGYDVSVGMLKKLKEKYPMSDAFTLYSNFLPEIATGSCDMVISTLTIAHIENIKEAITEWCRVLNNDGEILITDYHPEMLQAGGDRTFNHNGKTIAVKNYLHTLTDIFDIMLELGLNVVWFNETILDNSLRHYYERQNALHVFDRFHTMPLIYGIHLKKKHATS